MRCNSGSRASPNGRWSAPSSREGRTHDQRGQRCDNDEPCIGLQREAMSPAVNGAFRGPVLVNSLHHPANVGEVHEHHLCALVAWTVQEEVVMGERLIELVREC